MPNHVVAKAGAEDVFSEVFENVHGIFEGPGGVTGVDIGADKVGSGGFDEFDEFPGVEVAGVVFDGDFYAGFEGVGFASFEDFDGVGDSGADSAGCFAVFAGAEDDAVDGGAEGFCDTDTEAEMVFGGAPFVFESDAGGADAPAAGIDGDSEFFGFCANGVECGVLEGFVAFEVTDEEGVAFEFVGVVEELIGFPAHGADGEVVVPEFDFCEGGVCGLEGWRDGGQRGERGHAEEGAAGEGGVHGRRRTEGMRDCKSLGGR